MSNSLEKFAWEPNRVRRVIVARYNTLVTRFESGKVQTRAKAKMPRRWILDFDKQNMTSDEAKEIREFFEARKGRWEPFEWDYKDDEGVTETVTVRFDTDSLDRQEEWDTIYRFQIPFVEVL